MLAATAAARPQPIDPLNALLLRVRAVHDAVYGAASARAPAPPPIPPAADAHGDVPADSALPLVARTARAGALLRERAQQDPALSALLSNYTRDQPYLSPEFVLSGHVPDEEQSPAPPIEAQLSLLVEMLPQWKEAARQLEECSLLDKRDVLTLRIPPPPPEPSSRAARATPAADAGNGAKAAGEMPSFDSLEGLDARPRTTEGVLDELAQRLAAFDEQVLPGLRSESAQVEDDMNSLLATYGRYVDTVSTLFVEWDQALFAMERQVTQLEAQHKQAEEAETL